MLEGNQIKGPKELEKRLITENVFKKGDPRIADLIKIINRAIRLKDDAVRQDRQLEELGFYWDTTVKRILDLSPEMDKITALRRLLEERKCKSTADFASWHRITVIPFFSKFRADVSDSNIPALHPNDCSDDDLPPLVDDHASD